MRELTQKELVTIALFLLGGDKVSIDTEDVAIKAAEIAPGKFSWRKYRENIDQELVRAALKNAKIELKYIVGSQKEGWMLSPSGLRFARESSKKEWAKPAEREPERVQVQLSKEKERLMATDVYQQYKAQGRVYLANVQKNDADVFFRINDYVRGEARIKKINRIANIFIDDPELGELVKKLASLEKETKA
jgi:hypothetical protein